MREIHLKKIPHAKLIWIALSAAICIVGVIVIMLASQPPRSVSAFCSTLQTENASLSKSGKAYHLGPVSSSANDIHAFAVAYEKLDQVAPSDIEPDVRVLKLTAEKIDNDPSQSLVAGLSALGASSNVQQWTTNNCHIAISQ